MARRLTKIKKNFAAKLSERVKNINKLEPTAVKAKRIKLMKLYLIRDDENWQSEVVNKTLKDAVERVKKFIEKSPIFTGTTYYIDCLDTKDYYITRNVKIIKKDEVI